jgi:hypothetical protein
VIARTLARRIVLRTTDPAVFEAIRFLECDPEVDEMQAADRVLTVEPFRSGYRIIEDHRPAEEILDVKSAVDRLHLRLFFHSIEDRPDAGILHAAALRSGSQRILLVGSEAAGKTSLALRLAQSGFEVEGDEHVFLEDDGVIARPRGCRVKETSLALLPAIAANIAAAPVYVDEDGRRTFNVDPRLIGGTWRIRKGPVDAVIVLKPNHGGSSSLRPMAPLAVAQAVISELGLRAAGRSASIGAVARLVSRTKLYDLWLGDHATAVTCIESVLTA